MFTDKVKQAQNIVLIENETVISEKSIVAEKLNNFFINAASNLEIKLDHNILTDSSNVNDPVLKAIKSMKITQVLLQLNKMLI